MKYNKRKRFLSFLTALVLLTALLPANVLAADCAHEFSDGVCTLCKQPAVAAVGKTQYADLAQAVQAAQSAEDPAVVLLGDLTGAKLDLGKAYLLIQGETPVKITDSTITGAHADQVVKNTGNLILQNVTVKNTSGTYALYCEGDDSQEEPFGEATINGGRYEGAVHAIGAKQMKLMLGAVTEGETVQVPQLVSGKDKAAFVLEDSAVEVLCDLGDTVYSVESKTPGVFAFFSEYNPEAEKKTEPKESWFTAVNGTAVFQKETNSWSLSNDIAGAVAAETTELVYNGEKQSPAGVTVTLYGKTLAEQEDYTIAYQQNGAAVTEPVNVGEYQLLATGTGDYAGTAELPFKIVAVEPTVEWAGTSESVGYSGQEAAISTKVNVILLNEESYTGEVTYAYRAVGSEEFTSGLPVEVGDYEVKAMIAAGGNYTAAETEQYLALTVSQVAATELTIGGVPTEIRYGMEPFALNAAGVPEGAAVEWSITKGGEFARVDQTGKVEVTGAGEVTVQAKVPAGAQWTEATAECTFRVQPAVLTVSSVTAEGKVYDGNPMVPITAVTLSGVLGQDVVSVELNQLKGELSGSNAGTYQEVKLPELKLTGAQAANYALTQPTGPVSAEITVKKANLSEKLADVKASAAVDSETITVEGLGAGMPSDAGTLHYQNKSQDTGDGNTVIVLDWSVDQTGKVTAKIVNGTPGDEILFDVVISSDNYNDTVVRGVITLGALAVDGSKVTVTPNGSPLTYNGKEQKVTWTAKLGETALTEGTDFEVTYPADVTNAGDKEVTLQFKGKYSGSVTAKYSIAKAKLTVSDVKVQDKTYDGTTKATVTGGKLTGAVSGDDIKVAATGVFADKNSGSSKTVQLTYKLAGKAADNYELTETTGTATGRIYAVSSGQLAGKISGISASNVNSNNRSTLRSVVDQANAAMSDGGLSSNEKSGLSNVRMNAEELIGRIDSAAAASATASIKATAKVTSETVTLEDQPALVKAQSDLNNALKTYGGNYTSGEKKEIQNQADRVTKALTVIGKVQSAVTMIEALPDTVQADTPVDSNLKKTVADAQAAFDALDEYQKGLIDEDMQLKLTTVAKAVGQAPVKDEESTANRPGSDAQEEAEEGFHFPVWILIVALLVSVGCGGGLLWYMRKQKEESTNW